jgi:3-oxoacyl-[acyl-carrier-protein] synthase II
MMGHSLGAAGAIEAVICLLAMQHNLVPANINFREQDEDIALDIVANQSRSALLKTTLSNSFGFGGTNASIVMQHRHE